MNFLSNGGRRSAVGGLFPRGRRSAVGGFFPRGRRSAVGGLLLFVLTLLFTGLALLQLSLVDNRLGLTALVPLLVLAPCYALSVYGLAGRGDGLLLGLTFFLTGLGLVLLARLEPAFVSRQLAWLVAATLILLVVALAPHNLNWLRRYKFAWLSGGLLLLAATLVFGVNPSGFGARLWLQVGDIYFQPSEPLKLLLVIFLAAYLADRRRQLIEIPLYIGGVPVPHPSFSGSMFLMWGFSIILLLWQRDLGAALLFFGTFLGMLYVATGQQRYLWAGGLLLLVAGVIGYYLFDVVRLRMEAFGNPWLDPAGRSFQIVQSLLAFASGGIFGQGLGQGLPTAIPVVHTDFVFAAIGEEYGLLGALGVLVCFVLLISRAFRLALAADNEFEQLLAAGIGTMLGLQTLVITAGTLKLLPLTGVTLPLVSYGGSSLVTTYAMIGLLLYISRSESASQPVSESASQRVSPQAPHPTPLTLRPSPYAPRFSLSPALLRLVRALLNGFVVVAGGLIFWQVVLAPFLVQRDDNPRLVIAEQQIRRGRILTADGVAVAQTIVNADGLTERNYTYQGLSSVTGYYSIRYGVGGTEAAFDPVLRGTAGRSTEETWLAQLLHRPLVGRDVTLTISLPAQAAADVAMGNQEGAVVVMEIDTGAILVMSSHPTYNPNTLDEQWDSLRKDRRAPLLNRATQGLFPVGDLARFIGLIGLVEAGTTVPPDPLNAPLEELLAPLSSTGYLATARQLGLTSPLKGLPSQRGLLPDFTDKGTVRDLAVTPLHLARVLAALDLAGRLPQPVLSLQGTATGEPVPAINPETARYVRSLLPQVDTQVIGWSGQATPLETGQAWLSWFAGLTPAEAVPPPAVQTPVDTKLILDPTQIPARPTPAAPPNYRPARYVVVAVVVTDNPAEALAWRIARAPLNTLLRQ